eukprot:snap_masked-scaffold_1-processed-gene-30.17-mRNA-1 protein AED:1.00 eAED:1.00 QI:0/0/0/0/1/1/2/0/81
MQAYYLTTSRIRLRNKINKKHHSCPLIILRGHNVIFNSFGQVTTVCMFTCLKWISNNIGRKDTKHPLSLQKANKNLMKEVS